MRAALRRASAIAAPAWSRLGLACAAMALSSATLAGAGPPPLVDAARNGDWDAVRRLLETGASPGAVDGEGSTALHWAVRADNAELVQMLIAAGADPSATTDHGVTPLALAAVNGSARITDLLLQAGASPNVALPEGETVLMTAARTGSPEVLEALLEHGADVHAREHWFGETAVMWAAAENHPEAVAVLAAYGADLDARSARFDFPQRRAGQSILPLGSWTPLMYAARQGALDAARALLDLGADPDLADPDGATALIIAIINANYDVAALLLEKGADPNIGEIESGMAALYAAVDMNTLAVGHGRPNPRSSGPTGVTDLIEKLLAHGADPNARLRAPIMQRQHTAGDRALGEGTTPFMRAAKSGDLASMRLLLAGGADPTAAQPSGNTALMFAAGLGWRDGSPAAPAFDQGSEQDAIEAIALCLELGLDINAVNDRGDTALHAAVSGRGSPAIVRFLVEKGANLHAVNKDGRTPLDLASNSRRPKPEVAEVLRELMEQPIGVMYGMRRTLPAAVRGLVVALALWCIPVASLVSQSARPGRAGGAAPAPDAMDADAARALVTRYCVACHNERAATTATASGVVFDRADFTRLVEDGAMWEKVIRKLQIGAMPPPGMPRPDPAVLEAFVGYLAGTLDRAAAEHPRPGRPLPHRLNRAEYANAIRDLLALDIDPATLLPPDDSAAGFDNNADVLGVSPALLERYLAAAARISALAVGSPRIRAGSETYRVRGDASQTGRQEGLPFGTRGGLAVQHTFPLDGEYSIRVKLLETNLGSIRGLQDRHELEITVDGERVLLAPVGGPEDYAESSRNATNVVNSLATRLQARVQVRAGQRTVTAAFLQKPRSLGGLRLQSFRRSTLIATDHLGLPHVEHITISGPFDPAGSGDTPSRARIFTCRPATPSAERPCAADIVSTLARRAYRRPVTPVELQSLLSFYDDGREEGGFERGIELALRAILVSPSFVFRVEREPAGAAPGTPYEIDDLELASRLSFFLWSSIPDDELLDAAVAGRLRDPAALDAQVRRMLADPRSEALVANFAAQWLHVRNIHASTPDKNDFPDFDDNLRHAFEREMELFVGSIIREDRSVLDLFTADYTFVNERLAAHYGIPNVYGPHFRRVRVANDARRGLLGKGGLLLVTSHADRTSPVVRGKWILENVLGITAPPPPAEVPPFPEEAPGEVQTVRARMELHRASPSCAGCHKLMDPPGLALENFDAVGAWRTDEDGAPIDASAYLWDGTYVEGVSGLRDALLARPDVLVQTITEKLLTYALGRGLTHYDQPAVRGIVRAARHDDYRFSSLVRAIVTSVPFRMRTAGG